MVDVNGVGNHNDYLFAGTKAGHIFVTFTGGGGNGNAWLPLSNGLDGSPVEAIIANPNIGSHEAYAVTQKGVYHMLDAKAGDSWVNITGNLFSLLHAQFGDTSLGTQKALQELTSIVADWRYVIPNDFSNPGGPTHPMLYVGGYGGVFRSYDDGTTWSFFPDSAINADGSINSTDLLNSPLGVGGGLPDVDVTDLDLSLGNISDTTGRPDVSSGPNLLTASTYGRGSFSIRLAPIVFPNNATTAPHILALDTTLPVAGPNNMPPAGSDSGSSNTDGVTNVTSPYIDGLSEESAFGNVVTIQLFDDSDPTKGLIPIPLDASVSNQTDSTGHFRVKIADGYFDAVNHTSDGPKKILVQATDQSGTKGNLAELDFILDTTPPLAPGGPINGQISGAAPDLLPSSDTGIYNNDDITSLTSGLNFNVVLSPGEPTTTTVYLVRDNIVVASASGVPGGQTIVLTDPGTGLSPITGLPIPALGNGVHIYSAYEVDLAGNQGPSTAQLKVTVNTIAPAEPNAPILDPLLPAPNGSDSGKVGDDITNINQPYFSGSAQAGGLIQIIDASGTVQNPADMTPNVAANGQYAVRPSSPLPDGTYTFRVIEEDLAGNFSQPSSPIQVTILTRTPTKPTLFLVAADESVTVGDNITNVVQPRLTGTATPGLSVQLILDSGTAVVPGFAAGSVIAPIVDPTTGVLTPIIVSSGWPRMW